MNPRLCGSGTCGRPAHQDLAICVHCTWLLERDLADTPDLVRELETTWARQTATTPTAGSRSSVIPLPFDPRARDAVRALRHTLDGWAARIERAVTGRARPLHTAGLARWLLHHYSDLVAQHDAGRAVTDVGDVVARGWRAVDRPADRVYAGVCTKPCLEQLYARPGQSVVTCRACGTMHDTKARREQMRAELDNRLMTGAEIARLGTYFGHITDRERARNLIKVWANRGLVIAHSHTEAGDPRYPFGEVLDRLLDVAVASTEHRVLPSKPPERTTPRARR